MGKFFCKETFIRLPWKESSESEHKVFREEGLTFSGFSVTRQTASLSINFKRKNKVRLVKVRLFIADVPQRNCNCCGLINRNIMLLANKGNKMHV